MKTLGLKLISAFVGLPAKLSILGLRFWHKISEPLLGEQCRFYPSCSVYTREAIEKRGFIRGWFIGLKRLGRCHPFSKGGVDKVPE